MLWTTFCDRSFKFKINSISRTSKTKHILPELMQIFVIVCYSLADTNLRIDERITFIRLHEVFNLFLLIMTSF